MARRGSADHDGAKRQAPAPGEAPRWIGGRSRYLDEPLIPGAGGDPGLMEDLTFASPAECEGRNVTVDDEPLRRANTPRR